MTIVKKQKLRVIRVDVLVDTKQKNTLWAEM